MELQGPGSGGPLGPRERARFVSFAPLAASDWGGSVGMLAARYRDAPATEVEVPPRPITRSSWSTGRRRNAKSATRA